MARLMMVPIRNRGDSVLIITHSGDCDLVGFVARNALSVGLESKPSMCECVQFVQQNLSAIERILVRKANHDDGCADDLIPCVEITADDLAAGGINFAQP